MKICSVHPLQKCETRTKDRASQAAQHRRAFSWSNGARASYFRRTLEIIDAFAIMTVYDNYAFWNSYFGPTPSAPVGVLKVGGIFVHKGECGHR
jgi:hypothetical protein